MGTPERPPPPNSHSMDKVLIYGIGTILQLIHLVLYILAQFGLDFTFFEIWGARARVPRTPPRAPTPGLGTGRTQ